MKLRDIVNIVVLGVLLVGFIGAIRQPEVVQAGSGDKIEVVLMDKLSMDGQADYIVRFSEQADLSPAYQMDWQARGEFVVQALTEAALRSQANAKGILDVQGTRYQTFIAGNELYVWGGNLAATSKLASLPEVESIRSTRTYSIDPIRNDGNWLVGLKWAGDLLAYGAVASVGNTPAAPTTLAWGISYTKADQFWGQFGVQGEGTVVANIDTGVQWNHPALDQAFKCGSNPADAACWYDPADICGGSACDNNGHGTHTMGSMVGDDDPTLAYQVGMAPSAKWIACKGCESDSCSDYALNSCADWILQPGGSSANRPNVVNNSWGDAGGDNWYLAKVNAWRAAGIFPAFSAGNSGSSCNTLGSPGDYAESFASAAHDSGGNAASFSSRGPSTYGDNPYTKPNIAAPGVSICSSVPGNGWNCGYSGTSMASPHTAGAVALLWSCNPGLVGQIDATFQVLQDTASAAPAGNCGAPADGQGNFTYGYGYLDVFQAGIAACGGVSMGTLEGYVKDGTTGDPIEGASVSASKVGVMLENVDATTDPSGYYTMTLPVGNYDVTASKYGYLDETVSGVQIVTDTVTRQDFQMEWVGAWVAGPTDPADFTRYDCAWFDDGSGSSAYNQKVYCMGGRSGSSSELPDIWRFDPVVGVFSDTGNDMIVSISNYTALVLRDADGWAIYVVGGYDMDTPGIIDDVQRYDPSTGNIQLISTDPVPIQVGGQVAIPGACAVVQNKVYCFGGWNSSTTPYFTAATWEFDPLQPAGGRWKQISTANLSEPRGYIQVAVQSDKIYALGGISAYTGDDLIPSSTAEVLDINQLTQGWQTITSLPVATGEGRGFGFGADTLQGVQEVWDNKLYIVGGGDWPSESSEVLEYDVLSNSWSQAFPELMAPRRDHAGVFIPTCTNDPDDGLPGMWVFGGRQGSDDPPFGEPEYFPFPCVEPPPPLELVKTVGLEANECAVSDHVEILTDTLVTYCFTLVNQGELTFTTHDLVDSQLGTILDGYEYVLAPGESFYVTQSMTVSVTTISVATWTALTETGGIYKDKDITVVVEPGSYFVAYLPAASKDH
jgi:subtilisin family serine protease